MRLTCLLLALSSIVLAACSRSIAASLPANPLLIKTVTCNSTGKLVRVAHYSVHGLTSDTAFNNGGNLVSTFDTYNGKGKVTLWQLAFPLLYSGGYYREQQSVYQNDTVLLSTADYLKDNLTGRTSSFYTSSGQPLLDSVYHLRFTK